MVSKRLSALSVLLAVWLMGFPLLANATAIAHGDLAFSNLAITPAAGSVTLDGPWLFEAFAQANNSLGQINDQFNSGSSPGAVSASAAVTWASATGAASAPNDPPNLAVTGGAISNVNIPGCVTAAAFSGARGTFFNFFTLSGGGPSVNVTFGIDISGLLNAVTGPCGILAQSEVVFTLEVDGTPILFHQDLLSVGRNDAASRAIATSLSNSVLLDSDVSHFLLLEADSESRGQTEVPLPPVGALLIAGLIALAAARRARFM